MTEYASRIPLRMPEKLHGRDKETATLLNAFERVSDRQPEVVFISGEPGLGKTALVERLRKPVLEVRGFFISGKFGQNNRHKPLSALVDALSSLAEQIAQLDDQSERHAWARRIETRLNGNADVLVDMVPAMQAVLGERPPPLELEPEPARIRMQDVVLNTLRSISDGNRTLVVFLDDLQWADRTTLDLEQMLVSDESSRIMLIGAYRSSEIDALHPLTPILEQQRAGHAQRRLPLTEIALEPLTGFDVQSLLVEVLGGTRVELRELAMICQDRTGGNPFHMLQFLLAMQDQSLLHYAQDLKRWQWDADGIRDLPATGNVVELLATRIAGIGEELRELLGTAACFGSRFPVRQLADVRATSLQDLSPILGRALAEGFLVPDTDLRITLTGEHLPATCRFVHDKVEEAAYGALPQARRLEAHCHIGWALRAAATGLQRDAYLLDAAGQLMLARSIIMREEEAQDAAEIMLEAARVARRMTAWSEVRRFAAEGRRLLTSEGWANSPDRMYALSSLALESAYFVQDDNATIERLLDECVQHASSALQRAELYRIRTVQMVMRADWDQCIALGMQAMHACFDTIPESPAAAAAALPQLEREIATELAKRDSHVIASLPTTSDERAIFLYKLEPSVAFAAFPSGNFAMRRYLPLIGVRTILRFGLSAEAFPTLGGYTAMLGASGRFRLAGNLAEQVARDPRLQQRGPLYAAGANGNTHRALHFSRTFMACAMLLQEAHSVAQSHGDPFTATICLSNAIPMSLAAGQSLQETSKLIDDLNEANSGWNFPLAAGNANAFGDYLRSLREGTQDQLPQEHVSGPGTQEATTFWHNQFHLQAAFWLDAEALLVPALAAAEQTLPVMMGFPQSLEYLFIEYSLLRDYRPDCEPAARRERMQRARNAIEEAAECCEQNYGHLALLLEAEDSWQAGDMATARTGFERVIMLTRETGNLPYQALASERLSALQEERGKPVVASGLRAEAIRLYREWGCEARASRLAISD